MNREDFPMLTGDLIYLDNSATSLKPKCVIDKINDYYNSYSANAHRGDYDISFKVDTEYEKARSIIAKFLNANDNEIVFTSGATDSLNMVANGYFENKLVSGDEILITKTEHASNVLPWFNLSKRLGVNVKYIELASDYSLTLENVKKSISSKTKVIALAYVTNTIGDIRPLKQIIEYAHSKNILIVVDAAQAFPHLKIDVKDLDVDFLAFSGHKCLGPTGIGVLYAKSLLLENLYPVRMGGGMNESFDDVNSMVLKDIPTRFEAGTPNIAGAIGLGEAIKYLENIGMDNIHAYEVKLKKLLVSKLENINHIKILNPNTESGLVTFTIDGIFSQDVAFYLNKYNICVRAGNHCAKLLKDVAGVTNTVRVSIYFYNTEEEIIKLASLLSDKEKIIREMI